MGWKLQNLQGGTDHRAHSAPDQLILWPKTRQKLSLLSRSLSTNHLLANSIEEGSDKLHHCNGGGPIMEDNGFILQYKILLVHSPFKSAKVKDVQTSCWTMSCPKKHMSANEVQVIGRSSSQPKKVWSWLVLCRKGVLTNSITTYLFTRLERV